VAVGRALLVNPDWVEMVRTGHLEGAKPFAPEALGTLVTSPAKAEEVEELSAPDCID